MLKKFEIVRASVLYCGIVRLPTLREHETVRHNKNVHKSQRGGERTAFGNSAYMWLKMLNMKERGREKLGHSLTDFRRMVIEREVFDMLEHQCVGELSWRC